MRRSSLTVGWEFTSAFGDRSSSRGHLLVVMTIEPLSPLRPRLTCTALLVVELCAVPAPVLGEVAAPEPGVAVVPEAPVAPAPAPAALAPDPPDELVTTG